MNATTVSLAPLAQESLAHLAQASRLCSNDKGTSGTPVCRTGRFAPSTEYTQTLQSVVGAQARRLRQVESRLSAKQAGLCRGAFTFILLLSIGLNYSYGQINSSAYHIVRNDLQNSFVTFSNKKKGKVAFLGGSITYNPGWRDSISNYIEKRFPETDIEFIAAGIPSMGSTPGSFRLERDILSKGKIDLLFVEAAVNDPTNGRSSTEQIRAMEGILRHARSSNPKIDIITMYFVDPDKMENYNNEQTPEVIKNHEKVASQYQITSINLAKEVTERINAEEFDWEHDFKNLHPSPFGQVIYYNSIKELLEQEWKKDPPIKGKIKKHVMPEKLDQFSYAKGKIIHIKKAILQDGWKIDPFWKPSEKSGTRAGYVNVPMLISDQPSSELTLKFKGKAIGIAVATGPDAGIIEYSIDGGNFKQLDLFTEWSSQLHLPWYYVLEAELPSSKHILTIRIIEQKNNESKGNACRIKHFFINEK